MFAEEFTWLAEVRLALFRMFPDDFSGVVLNVNTRVYHRVRRGYAEFGVYCKVL